MIKTYKCAMPWSNLHITPEGRVAPCMQYTASSRLELELYNLKSHSLEEAINSPGMKEVRRSMMNEQPNDLCKVCDYRDSNNIHSTRQEINDKLLDRVDFTTTQEDGHISIEDFKPLILDVRFSNICNLKCRMCSHEYSSAWYDEAIEISKTDKTFVFSNVTKQDAKFHGSSSYDDIEPMLDYVETIYFAGGEPLITPDHYRVLDYLIKNGRASQVVLIYSTNLTVSSYKGKMVRDYWAEFNRVEVAASIDGMGDVGEYVRTNLIWNDAVRVYNELKPTDDRYSNIMIYACITISLLNVYHMPEFIKWCLENGWIHKSATTYAINFVDYPFEMSVKALPVTARNEVVNKYHGLIDWMKDNDYMNGVEPVKDIIKYINNTNKTEEEISELNKQLIERLNIYDKSGGLNWRAVLPELREHLE